MRISEGRLRRIIRSVIRESVDGVNKISGEIDLEKAAYEISYLIDESCAEDVDVVYVEETIENLKKYGFTFTIEDFNNLKALCVDKSYKAKDLYDEGWGSRTFKREVFVRLGLTQNDFEFLLSLNREHNAVEDSDYWMPFVSESGEDLTFSWEF